MRLCASLPAEASGGRPIVAADGAWVAPQEDLLDGRAVGDVREDYLGVVQITEDLVV